jgi:hypothetical protein
MSTLSGQCLCRQVRLSVHCEPLRIGTCHCTDCRKESGFAFTFYAVWPRDRFHYSGDILATGPSFCPQCGARVFSIDDREAEVKLGILDHAPTHLTTSYEL